MNIENSKKYEQLILDRIQELNDHFLHLSEEKKKDSVRKIKVEEQKALKIINEFDAIINENNEILSSNIQSLNEQETFYDNSLNKFLNDIHETTSFKNKKLNDELVIESDNYKDFVEKHLKYYELNLNRLTRKYEEIKKFTPQEFTYKFQSNKREIETKTRLINESSKHYQEQLKANKDKLLNDATFINDAVKKIKKEYIAKEEKLKKEHEHIIYMLNEKIKELNAKITEAQKPYLIKFKLDFEKCDQDMLVIRKNHQNNIQKLENEYKIKINILNDKISYLEKIIKNKVAKESEINDYKRLKKELSSIKNEVINKQFIIEKKYYADIDNLHKLQKESENLKNSEIKRIKDDIDFEIAEIQENIKLQNSLYDCNLRILKIKETIEITEIDINLDHSEIKKAFDDNVATSNQAAFHNDYTSKIQLLKLTNKHLSENQETYRHIDLYENEVHMKRNEIINNLAIEHSLLALDHKKRQISNKIKQNELLHNKNEKMLKIRHMISKKDIEVRKTALTEKNNLINNDIIKKRSLEDIKKVHHVTLLRIEHAQFNKSLKYLHNIENAKMENQTFKEAISSLNELLIFISNDLNDTLYTNFTTFGIEKVKKMMSKAAKDMFQLIKSYFKLIENVINKKIDEIASFKFKTLFTDNLDSKNEFVNKTNEQIAHDQVQIEKYERENATLESQAIYLEIDNSSLQTRVNFLTKEVKITKKDTEFNSEKLINRYLTEIKELKQNILSNKNEIQQKRHTIKDNNLEIQKLNIAIENAEKAIKNKIKEYKDYNIKLDIAKVKAAKIYYETISEINNINKQFQSLFSNIENKVVNYFTNNENIHNNHIKKIIDKEIKITSNLTNRLKNLLDVLYKNIINEQNSLIRKNTKKANQLKIHAYNLRLKNTKNEKKRYKKEIRQANYNIKSSYIEKEDFIKLRLIDLLNNENDYKANLNNVKNEVGSYDIIYRNQYKGLAANAENIRAMLIEQIKENKVKDILHVKEIEQKFELDKQKIEEDLKIYALINEKEISSYTEKYETSIKEADLEHKEKINDLLQKKKEAEDNIIAYKKAYESFKEENNLDRIQFHEGIKDDKNQINPISFLKKRPNFENIKIKRKIKKKWN